MFIRSPTLLFLLLSFLCHCYSSYSIILIDIWTASKYLSIESKFICIIVLCHNIFLSPNKIFFYMLIPIQIFFYFHFTLYILYFYKLFHSSQYYFSNETIYTISIWTIILDWSFLLYNCVYGLIHILFIFRSSLFSKLYFYLLFLYFSLTILIFFFNLLFIYLLKLYLYYIFVNTTILAS